jgi:hypothetical protein
VDPTSTTTYTLTATNSAGSTTSTATVTVTTSTNPCAGLSLGTAASLNGFVPFPSTNYWNTNISSAAIDPNSSSYISAMGSSTPVHADWDNVSGGIPYIIVDSTTTPLVTLSVTGSPSESDILPWPYTSGVPIEAGSDHHTLVIDRATCGLMEAWESSYSGGVWTLYNTALWDLSNFNDRPYSWTSADAAGLSVFAGLVKYQEVAYAVANSQSTVGHAFRCTTSLNSDAVAPATHIANSGGSVPMGIRLRLHASADVSSYTPETQVVLNTLKTYGCIVADGGSTLYVTGSPDPGWSNVSDFTSINNFNVSDFDVVTTGSGLGSSSDPYNGNNWPNGSNPTISSFTASATTVSSGAAVTLNWSTSGSSYLFIDPSTGDQVGFVRGTSVVVNPTTTTTYTLNATNAYGVTTARVTVTVN